MMKSLLLLCLASGFSLLLFVSNEEPSAPINDIPSADMLSEMDMTGRIWYVSQHDSLSAGDGSSWASPLNNLQSAIDTADLFDTIWVAGGLFTAESTFIIQKRTQIYGGFTGMESSLAERQLNNTDTIATFSAPTILSGNNLQRVLSINLSSELDTVLIDGLEFRNGAAEDGAGIYFEENGYLSLSNVSIEDNEARNIGGGIYAKGPLSIQNTSISNNVGSFQAGGVFAEKEMTINLSIIDNNSANIRGGGLFVQRTLEINDSRISNNSILNRDNFSTRGAGIQCQGILEINNSKVIGNIGANRGGGINAINALTLNNSIVENNSAELIGGGIHTTRPLVIENNSIIRGNSIEKTDTRSKGAGVFARDRLSLTQSEISDNEGAFKGGGIYVEGSIIVEQSLIQNNATSFQDTLKTEGGGIYAEQPLQITNSEIIGNRRAQQGGGIFAEDSLLVSNCIFQENRALFKGAGISATNYFSIENSSIQGNIVANGFDVSAIGGGIHSTMQCFISNCTFAENTATQAGGGIYAERGMLVEDCTIERNFSNFGGGIRYLSAFSPDSTTFAQVENNILRNNRAKFFGGAIATFTRSTVNIFNNKIYNNVSEGEGGGVFVIGGNNFIEGDSIRDNIANLRGGGIVSKGVANPTNRTRLTITNTVITNDSCGLEGGGIYSSGSFLTLKGISITNNTSGQDGGGLYTAGNYTKLDSIIIFANTATLNGGGLYAMGDSTEVLKTSIINNAAPNGGGIFANGNVLEVNLSTLTRNQADTEAGAIFANGILTIDNSSIYQNNSSGRVGGILVQNAQINNSLIYRNTASDSTFSFGAALHASRSLTANNCTFYNNQDSFQISTDFAGIINNSIVWSPGQATIPIKEGEQLAVNHCLLNRPYSGLSTANIIADPLFVDSTRNDFRLEYCSRAIDAGDNDAVNTVADIRDTDRILDRQVDMGAYEMAYPSSGHYFVNAAESADGRGVSWECPFKSLTEAINIAQAGDSIWVAQGTYLPQTDLDGKREDQPKTASTFFINKNLTIRGGFSGMVEDSLFSNQDFISYPTILSGDSIAHHVVFSENQAQQSLLEGLIIQDGFSPADTNLSLDQRRGAGLFGRNTALQLQNITFRHNQAGESGGAMAISGESFITCMNCNFFSNSSTKDGGAVFMIGDGILEISNTNFRYNQANFEGKGGAVYLNLNGAFNIHNSSFLGNNGHMGGALYLNNTSKDNFLLSPLICKSDIVSPTASLISNNDFLANNAIEGGAIYLESTAPVFINKANFRDNNARHNGGAITNRSDSLMIINSLITASNAERGAAIYASENTALINCTIAGNSVSDLGATVEMEAGLATISKSIIWGNGGGKSVTDAFGGLAIQIDTSIVERGCDNLGNTACLSTSMMLDIDPAFADAEAGEFWLREDSPAKDAATFYLLCFDNDLAGNDRSMGAGVDMGAFESTGSLLVDINEPTLENALKIELYPNPAKEHFQLSLSKTLKENGQISLLNTTGQLIHATTLPKGTQTFQINLPANLSPGLYWVNLKTTKLNWSRRVVIVQ